MKTGLVQIYTGDGKGKTTAAIGQAIRALGRGLKATLIQFAKSEDSGEILFIKKAIPEFLVFRFNSQLKTVWKMNEKEIEKLRKDTIDGLNFAKEIINENKCDILILDEALWAVQKEYIVTEDLKNIIKSKPETMEIILTGRNASHDLIKLAHLVTEMKKIKHPFDNGINARTGIEK